MEFSTKNQPSTHSNLSSNSSFPSCNFDGMKISQNAIKGNSITHEMALELSIIEYLTNNHSNATQIFGKNWDYLSHQVAASPFKPPEYIDRMDIFGYKYIPNFRPTKSKFLLIELKGALLVRKMLNKQ